METQKTHCKICKGDNARIVIRKERKLYVCDKCAEFTEPKQCIHCKKIVSVACFDVLLGWSRCIDCKNIKRFKEKHNTKCDVTLEVIAYVNASDEFTTATEKMLAELKETNERFLNGCDADLRKVAFPSMTNVVNCYNKLIHHSPHHIPRNKPQTKPQTKPHIDMKKKASHKKKELSTADRVKIKELYGAGKSVNEIRTMFGIGSIRFGKIIRGEEDK